MLPQRYALCKQRQLAQLMRAYHVYLFPIPWSVFSDITLVAWNWLWWKYSHQKNWQILQIRAFYPLERQLFKHWPAHCCRWSKLNTGFHQVIINDNTNEFKTNIRPSSQLGYSCGKLKKGIILLSGKFKTLRLFQFPP